MMYDFDPIRGITESIIKQENEIIESVFLRCGYPRDWIIENRERVSTEVSTSSECESYTFKIDGSIVFVLRRVHEIQDGSYYVKWFIEC